MNYNNLKYNMKKHIIIVLATIVLAVVANKDKIIKEASKKVVDASAKVASSAA